MKENWQYKKLGEVCGFKRGLTYSGKDEVNHSNNIVLRSNNVDLDTFSLNFDELKYISEKIIIPEDKKLKKGTLLMCMSNGSKQHLGKVAYIDKDYPYAFGGFMGLLYPNENQLNPKYFYYYCCSPIYKSFLSHIGNGANINNLKFSQLAENDIPLPPLSTQQSIVAELDEINNLLNLKKKELETYDKLSQSLFYEMFGDPSFETKTLDEIYNFIDYRGKTPNKINSGIPLITAKNVRKGYLDYTVKDFISLEEYKGRQTRGIAKKGDLLFTTEAPLGYAAVADLEEYSAGQRVIALQSKGGNIVNTYAMYYILSDAFQYELSRQATGSTAQGIKASKLKNMSIPLPPLSLQEAFAKKIEAIEEQKANVKAAIEKLETLLASRMQFWFE